MKITCCKSGANGSARTAKGLKKMSIDKKVIVAFFILPPENRMSGLIIKYLHALRLYDTSVSLLVEDKKERALAISIEMVLSIVNQETGIF
jgi:hypothetical protein